MTTLHAGILNELADQLKLAYDDAKAVERATQKLQTLKQGAKSFANHLADFDRTLLDAGGGDWPEHVKKAFLSNSLSSELHKALVATPTPDTYREYCSLLQTVSHNLEAIRNRETQGSRLPRTIAPTKNVESEERMDWEPTRTTGIAAAQQRRAAWVSQEVIEKRKREGTCIRCGGDHFVRGCHLLPAVRPNAQTSSKRTTAATAKVEEVVEEEDNNSESEKV